MAKEVLQDGQREVFEAQIRCEKMHTTSPDTYREYVRRRDWRAAGLAGHSQRAKPPCEGALRRPKTVQDICVRKSSLAGGHTAMRSGITSAGASAEII